jgi:hypothetical protein
MVFMFTLSVSEAFAAGGASYTTFNAAVDGDNGNKDLCKNTETNCNIYSAKKYVWLNGGPVSANLGLGEYFFAVLEPGGQPNPNDNNAKNLSSSYDAYTNRTFQVTETGITYGGSHDFYEPGPSIRLFPYDDTSNNGGVYILAICSLDNGGYPVDPKDCKYDAFKVKEGKLAYSFYLSGQKFEDLYADGINDNGDPGLAGWIITISGTGPDGLPIDEVAVTGADGFWEYDSFPYTFKGNEQPNPVNLQVCEVLQDGWTQSYPTPDYCYDLTFDLDLFFHDETNLYFGNYQPVDVTACKEKYLGVDQAGNLITEPVSGWKVYRSEYGVMIPGSMSFTGADGCYTWEDLPPGIPYDVHEESVQGWEPLTDTEYYYDFGKIAVSGESLSHTFVNIPMQGCTPGFWQGGGDAVEVGGKYYWNELTDPDWAGENSQPFYWYTPFCSKFGCGSYSDPIGDGDMWYFINSEMHVAQDDFHKAARSLVAAYLNASWGMNYPYDTVALENMWSTAITAYPNTDALHALHTELDYANNAYGRTDGGPGGPSCPISANPIQ